MPPPFDTLVPVLDGTMRLAVRIWSPRGGAGGFRSGKALTAVAWPGWLDNVGSFEELAPILVEGMDMDVVCVDPPGNGWSEHRPASVIYNEHDEFVLLGHVADALGLDKFVVIGHSRGGAIAAMATAVLKQRVLALVVFESGLGLYRDADPTSPSLPERVALADEMFTKNRTRPPRVFSTVEEAIRFNATNETFPKSAVTARHIVLRHLRPCPGGFTFTHDVRTYGQRQYVGLTEPQIHAFLREIRCPVLRILRQSSAYFPKPEQGGKLTPMQEHFRARNACFSPGVLTDVIHAGDHHLHSDHARSVAEGIVIPWLRGRLGMGMGSGGGGGGAGATDGARL